MHIGSFAARDNRDNSLDDHALGAKAESRYTGALPAKSKLCELQFLTMDRFTRRQFLGAVALAAPTTSVASRDESRLQAVAWPEADSLFHREPDWLGADGVYSVDLGHGRILWLFGDTFIAGTPARLRSQSTVIRNSIAVQTGYNPASASIRFYWNHACTVPAEFFAHPSKDAWYWPAHGARLGSKLLLFLSEMRRQQGGLGFRGAGWTALLVENPDADPPNWRTLPLHPAYHFSLSVGSAALSWEDNLYLYCHSDRENGAQHHIDLARAPRADLMRGSFANLSW
ncbi:MAG TPA: hypothetical protein VGS41_15625, partial [Chthonomonadales bacterium]|nr:hypothetical protein [Chthonomonadales bacterium]